MRGAVVVFASGIDVTKGKDKLTEYRFNSQKLRITFVQFAVSIRFISVVLTLNNMGSTWPV